MIIHNKKNNICLIFVFLMSCVFSGDLFGGRRNTKKLVRHERSIEDLSVSEEYLTHLGPGQNFLD